MEFDIRMSRGEGLDALQRAAQAGNGDAFAELLQPHLVRAATVAAAITGSQDDGADAVQEALVGAWQGIGGVRNIDAIGAWFNRLVVRAAMRIAQKRRRSQVRNVPAAFAREISEPIAERIALERAFERLGPQDRAIVALRYVIGYSIEESAAILGIPEGTAKSRSHNALGRLRAAYERGEREPYA